MEEDLLSPFIIAAYLGRPVSAERQISIMHIWRPSHLQRWPFFKHLSFALWAEPQFACDCPALVAWEDGRKITFFLLLLPALPPRPDLFADCLVPSVLLPQLWNRWCLEGNSKIINYASVIQRSYPRCTYKASNASKAFWSSSSSSGVY